MMSYVSSVSIYGKLGWNAYLVRALGPTVMLRAVADVLVILLEGEPHLLELEAKLAGKGKL